MPETHAQPSSPSDIKHARLARFLDLLCENVDRFIRTSRHPASSGERLINSEDVSEAVGLLRELGLTVQADRLERGYQSFTDRLLTMRLDGPDFHLLDAEVQSDVRLITIGLAGELADFVRELRSDLSEMRLPKPSPDADGEKRVENQQDSEGSAETEGIETGSKKLPAHATAKEIAEFFDWPENRVLSELSKVYYDSEGAVGGRPAPGKAGWRVKVPYGGGSTTSYLWVTEHAVPHLKTKIQKDKLKH